MWSSSRLWTCRPCGRCAGPSSRSRTRSIAITTPTIQRRSCARRSSACSVRRVIAATGLTPSAAARPRRTRAPTRGQPRPQRVQGARVVRERQRGQAEADARHAMNHPDATSCDRAARRGGEGGQPGSPERGNRHHRAVVVGSTCGIRMPRRWLSPAWVSENATDGTTASDAQRAVARGCRCSRSRNNERRLGCRANRTSSTNGAVKQAPRDEVAGRDLAIGRAYAPLATATEKAARHIVGSSAQTTSETPSRSPKPHPAGKCRRWNSVRCRRGTTRSRTER